MENTLDLNGKFYLVAPNLLDSGSVVLPGNFGKNIKSHPAGSEKGILARELVFENVRLNKYPHLPSRLNCVFLFLDEQTATQQIEVIGGLAPCIYEVRLKDPTAKTIRCDMNHIGSVGNIKAQLSFFHAVDNIATQYWDQTASIFCNPVYEVITESPVIVERLINCA